MEHANYLKLAVEEARKGMRAGEGGPFGALLVKDGEIISIKHNTVLVSHDPTAHAEINVIRDASLKLKSPHLEGSVLYTNFEPCPMCLSAIYWAGIERVYYCAGKEEAEKAGFMDSKLYEELKLNPAERSVPVLRVELEDMTDFLEEWNDKEDRILY